MELPRVVFFGKSDSDALQFFNLELAAWKGERILDCPGGAGSLVALARRHAVEVVAVDPLYALYPRAPRRWGLFEQECFDLAWHRSALLELLRVSRGQVRLDPAHTVTRPARTHPYVEPLLAQLPPPWSGHLQSTDYDQGFEGATPLVMLERGRATES